MAALGASSQNRELRLISTVWPPFTNQPGQARFALDLVEHALGRIGITPVTAVADNAQFTNSLITRIFTFSWK